VSVEVVVVCLFLSPFIIAPVVEIAAGDRDEKRPGLIWNRNGWHDPDYELIEQLEQWELNWRMGCYDSDPTCNHWENYNRVVKHYHRWVEEERNKARTSRDGGVEYAEKRLAEEEKRHKPECQTLDESMRKRFVFAALQAHTKHVDKMVDSGRKWV
jgi:flagellar biosynthesis chaperone FliJ